MVYLPCASTDVPPVRGVFVYDPELNAGVNLHSMSDEANCFFQGEAVHIIARAAYICYWALGGGARVVVVLAALRDVAYDAEQGADEDGCKDKTNVTTKRCCTAAAETAREAATSACCSRCGTAAAPLRDYLDCSRQRHRA